MFRLIFSAVLVGLAVSSPLSEDVRIVGGEDIDILDAPYQVSLLRDYVYTCGGSIISKNLILTAAHCIAKSKPQEYHVRVGSSYSQKDGIIFPVSDFIWHPSFTYKNMESDVAILWLSRPLQFTKRVAPIELFNVGEEIPEGDLTAVTGWGNMMEGGGLPSVLQMVKVPIVNAKTCNSAYAPFYVITPTMLCAGVPQGGKDACQGDSGGPLVHNGRLAGIVSWGLGCARPDYPGVYAKVSALRKWIDEQSTYLRFKHLLRTVSQI